MAKIPVPAYVTLEDLRYSAACNAGVRYFEQLQDDFGRVRCDREAFDRVLDDHPGCLAWLLEYIADDQADAAHDAIGDVAHRELHELFSFIRAMECRCLEATEIWRFGSVPLEVDQALYMMCHLAHKDAIREIALTYFDIPEADERSE